MSLRYPSSFLPRGGYETAATGSGVARSASGIVAPTRCDERSSAPLQSRAASARYYLYAASSPRLLPAKTAAVRAVESAARPRDEDRLEPTSVSRCAPGHALAMCLQHRAPIGQVWCGDWTGQRGGMSTTPRAGRCLGRP